MIESKLSIMNLCFFCVPRKLFRYNYRLNESSNLEPKQ